MGTPKGNSITEILRSRALAEAERVAFTFADGGNSTAVTYDALDLGARQVAATLLQHGVNKADRVLVVSPGGGSFAKALFGCLYASVVAVPCAPPGSFRGKARDEALDHIVGDAAARVVLTTSALTQMVRRHLSNRDVTVIELDDCTDTDVRAVAEPNAVAGSDLAVLQYTSGTTKKPSGVMISHENISENCRIIFERFGHSNKSQGYLWLPPYHDMGLVGGFLQPVYGGFPCELAAPKTFVRNPMSWLRGVSRLKATTSGAPNFAFRLCSELARAEDLDSLDLSAWTVAFVGAEPIHAPTLEAFAEKFAVCGFDPSALYPCYGMAEATLYVTGASRPESYKTRKVPNASPSRRVVSCGSWPTEHELIIVDPQRTRVCDEDEVGEIWVSGKSVASGYWRQPKRTAETFRATLPIRPGRQYLRTGDLGFVKDDALFVTGRSKDLMIFEGRNFYAHEIEAAVLDCVPVGRCAAVSSSGDGADSLVVICEWRPRSTSPREELSGRIRTCIREQFGLEVREVEFVRHSSLPTTTSGKLQRRAVARSYAKGTLKLLTTRASEQFGTLTGVVDGRQANVQDIRRWLKQRIALQLQMSDVDIDAPFSALGLESLDATRLAVELNRWLSIEITPTHIYNHPTIRSLSSALAGSAQERNLIARPSEKTESAGVAVVGMACRFPGAATLQDFWKLVAGGAIATGEVPSERWSLQNPEATSCIGANWGGFVDEPYGFDPSFFRISDREASRMDPQHRILLMVLWEALEHAGLTAKQLDGTNTGTFVGISSSDHLLSCLNIDRVDEYAGVGNAHSLAANRLAYFLNLHGPSLAVDTACSSSLTALHYACESVRRGECERAIVAGVNLLLAPHLSVALAKAKMLSPTGACRVFDDAADGYVRGEGCGVVIIEPLADAKLANRRIHAVIEGSAVNQDGASNGVTAPNGLAQRHVLEEALRRSARRSSDISYLETHGTGTPLGDPIEFASVTESLGAEPRKAPCAIGSVKANIGHLEAAAGIAGFIKVVLALGARKLPAQANFTTLNRHIQAAPEVVCIPAQTAHWPNEQEARVAGVSSFGFGGTNAHVVVREARIEEAQERTHHVRQTPCVLTVSAADPQSLRNLLSDYQRHISRSSLALRETCAASNVTRSHLRYRFAAPAPNEKTLASSISAWLQAPAIPPTQSAHTVAFMFSGQGKVYQKMGRALLRSNPAFAHAIDKCLNIVRSSDELNSVFALRDDDAPADLLQDSIERKQLTTFCLQYALSEVWRKWGVTPDVVVGHSVGEVAAACVAGGLSVSDALHLVAIRTRIVGALRGSGAMIVAGRAVEALREVVAQSEVDIAAVNGPETTVISGEREALHRLAARLRDEGIRLTELDSDVAYHSRHLDPFVECCERQASQLSYPALRIPMALASRGEMLERGARLSAHYWARQLRSEVKFASAVDILRARGVTLALELGPSSTLCVALRSCDAEHAIATVPSLSQARDTDKSLLEALCTMHVSGLPIDWQAIHGNATRPLDLPAMRFRQRVFGPLDPDARNVTSVSHRSQSPGLAATDPAPPLSQASSETIAAQLCALLAERLDCDIQAIERALPFVDMGADSLALMAVLDDVRDMFDIELSVAQLFNDLSTVDALATHIVLHSHQSAPALPVNEAQELTPAPQICTEAQSSRSLERRALEGEHAQGLTMAQELRLLDEQLSLMRERVANLARRALPHSVNAALPRAMSASNARAALPLITPCSPTDSSATNGRKTSARPSVLSSPLTNTRRAAHIARLQKRYNEKTTRSKRLVQHQRKVLADNRVSAGFRPDLKELVYPVVGTRGVGAKIWDIDGNEYIDFTMGFGVSLFGHSPTFVSEALHAELRNGFAVGPHTPIAGEVAAKLSSLTGMARVAFCNSGTEAVMLALRLARAVTRRRKIVIFDGSYHGTFDGVLARAKHGAEKGAATPLGAGTSPNMIHGDVDVLDYCSPQALEHIASHAQAIAGVLVEPVQSRHLHRDPTTFLRELRALCTDHEIPLILDEMITGFRFAQGGAQEHFNVRADIATYGKIVGGGLPIGVVAGSPRFLDSVDGGYWNFGDESYPCAEQVVFAGTFNKHPLTMAAANAVLSELESSKGRLQQTLNQTTQQLCDELRTIVDRHGVALRIDQQSSMFRFESREPLDLLYLHLRQRGIYVWEGRTAFVSLAHSHEHFDALLRAVDSSVEDLAKDKVLIRLADADTPSYEPIGEQRRFFALAAKGDDGVRASTLVVAVRIAARLEEDRLARAIENALAYHGFSKLRLDVDGQRLRFLSVAENCYVGHLERNSSTLDDKTIRHLLETETQRVFRFEHEPPIRVRSLCAHNERVLCITVHHSLVDAWGLALLVRDIIARYHTQASAHAAASVAFRSHMQNMSTMQLRAEKPSHDYWESVLSEEQPKRQADQYSGSSTRKTLDPTISKRLRVFAKANRVPLFCVVLATFARLYCTERHTDRVHLGIPFAGRETQADRLAVSTCVNLFPITVTVADREALAQTAMRANSTIARVRKHTERPLAPTLMRSLQARVDAVVNLEPIPESLTIGGAKMELIPVPTRFVEFPIELHISPCADGSLDLELKYQLKRLGHLAARRWLTELAALLKTVGDMVPTAKNES